MTAPPAAPRGSDYAALIKTVRAAGLLDRRLGSYGMRALLTLGFCAATCFAACAVVNASTPSPMSGSRPSWFGLA